MDENRDEEVGRWVARLESPEVGPQVIEYGLKHSTAFVGGFDAHARVILPADFPAISEEEFERSRPLLEVVMSQTCIGLVW